MPNYDAVLFDFDGVLADTEPLHFRCWTQVLAGYGIHPTWEWFAQNCIGVSEHGTLQAFCHLASPPLDFETLWTQYPRKKQLFLDLVNQGIPLAPGASELLAGLQGRCKVAVVSSSARQEVQPALELAGVWKYFDASVFGREAVKLKPEPDPYLRAAELLHVERPLVVEDSAAGVASAQAAGFAFVRIASVEEMAGVVRKHLKDDS